MRLAVHNTTWGKPLPESQKTLPVGLHSQLPLTSIGGREQQVTYTSRLPKGYRPPDKPIFMAQLSTIYRDTPQAVRELLSASSSLLRADSCTSAELHELEQQLVALYRLVVLPRRMAADAIVPHTGSRAVAGLLGLQELYSHGPSSDSRTYCAT